MAHLTPEHLEQYLYCPRYFYLKKIKEIHLTSETTWTLTENFRKEIKRLTFQYFSYLAMILNAEIGKKITDLEKLEDFLSFECSSIPRDLTWEKNGFDLESKVYTFLTFILSSISQESQLSHRKKRYPTSITFFPSTDVSHDLIIEEPSILVDYSDKKKVLVIQNYSHPEEKECNSQINIRKMVLITLYKSNLTRIISMDYRSMEMFFEGISGYKNRISRSTLTKLLKKFSSQEFNHQTLNTCDNCEYSILCKDSEEMIYNG